MIVCSLQPRFLCKNVIDCKLSPQKYKILPIQLMANWSLRKRKRFLRMRISLQDLSVHLQPFASATQENARRRMMLPHLQIIPVAKSSLLCSHITQVSRSILIEQNRSFRVISVTTGKIVGLNKG